MQVDQRYKDDRKIPTAVPTGKQTQPSSHPELHRHQFCSYWSLPKGQHQQVVTVTNENAIGRSVGIDGVGLANNMDAEYGTFRGRRHDNQSLHYCCPHYFHSARVNPKCISTPMDRSLQTDFTDPRAIREFCHNRTACLRVCHGAQTEATYAKTGVKQDDVRPQGKDDKDEGRGIVVEVPDNATAPIPSSGYQRKEKRKSILTRFLNKHVGNKNRRSVSASDAAKPKTEEVAVQVGSPTCFIQSLLTSNISKPSGHVMAKNFTCAPPHFCQLCRSGSSHRVRHRGFLERTLSDGRLPDITEDRQSINSMSSSAAETSSDIAAMDEVSEILTNRFDSFKSIALVANRKNKEERFKIVSSNRGRLHAGRDELMADPYHDNNNNNNNNNNNARHPGSAGIGFVALSVDERRRVGQFYECIGSSIYAADSAAILFANSVNATSELTEWKRLYVGVPVWLFNTGIYEKRPRKLQLILSEIGSGFTLIDVTVDRLSELKHPKPGYITLQTRDKSSVIALRFFVDSASESFMHHLQKLKDDPRNGDIFGSVPETWPESDKKQRRKKRIHTGPVYMYTTHRVSKKAISRPISFTHMSSLRGMNKENLYSLRALL